MTCNFNVKIVTLSVAMAIGGMPIYVHAAEETVQSERDVEKIVVVGSRSSPRSIADSPVPIDVIGGEELGRSGSSDMLNQLVSAVPSFNVRAQASGDSAALIKPVNLRGLSSDSTLVLVNGKRRHRASVITFIGGGINDGAQGPDISVIPSVALKQVEVLRDGAAAQYGSDAIAGVMNFVLKDAADGGSLSIKQGEYFEGDGASTVVDGNIGLPFTADGFVNLSFQFKNADPTSRSVQGLDALDLIADGNTHINDPAQIWGNPEIKDDITLFANVGLDLGNDREFYLFGNYSERDVKNGFFYRSPIDPFFLGRFIADETNVLVGDIDGIGSGIECPNVISDFQNVLSHDDYGLIANPNTAVGQNCFAFSEMFPGGYTPQFGGNIVDTALTIGIKGEVNGGILDEVLYDLSGTVGRNASSYFIGNTINPSLGPNQPIDHQFEVGKYIQLEKAFNFDVVKSIGIGLDDPINVAGGLEWREESFEIVSGEESSWEIGNFAEQGFSIGSDGFPGFSPQAQGENIRRSFAAYVDVEIYLSDDFMIGTALRYEDFSSFGDTFNYKFSAQYSITDQLSFRGSATTGFRAPTVGQENVVNTSTIFKSGLGLATTGTYPATDPVSAFYGAEQLEPEESESYAFGLVFQEGEFFFTADVYKIDITDHLSRTSPIEVLDTDHTGLRAIGVSNPEQFDQIQYFVNDFDTTTQGIDVVANYSMELFNGDTQFSFIYNWNETEVDARHAVATSDFQIENIEKGIPEHRATFTVAQSWDSFSMFVRANYFGEYLATIAGEFPDTADSAVTFDAEMSYFVNDSVILSFGANNLLDKEAHKTAADSIPTLFFGSKYYESGPFDFNGGYYYVKATYKF